MTSERLQRLSLLLAAALRLEDRERERFIRRETVDAPDLRSDLLAMLRTSADEPIVAAKSVETLTISRIEEGRRIGPYRITAKIGSGGMGAVFRAVRDDEQFRKEVAIKTLPFAPDESLISRFKYERHALAVMEHPNIAKVLDAGVSNSGEPYLVMELVDGRPLTAHADRWRLSIADRLRLFIPVCKAVQHAHQKGIIHRDLKPSNVLVATVDGVPTPKVIDFGLAKAIHGLALAGATMHTQAGTALGTIEYMSPEQSGFSEDGVDTRTDVYSLGVMFYELLSGSKPFTFRPQERAADFLRRIAEEEMQPPSVRVRSLGVEAGGIASNRSTEVARLTRELSGELDWIAARALEKDPERRYESANAMALDIERHLNGDPIRASPASTTYRVKKFVRKHRLIIGVGAALAATLAMAAVVSTWQALKARRAEEVAQTVAAFLREDVLSQANPEEQAAGDKPRRELSVREALDRAASRIGPRFRDKPLVEAGIRRTIGESYIALGQFESALQQFQRAEDLLLGTLGPGGRETLAVKGDLGQAIWLRGQTQEGIKVLADVLGSLKSVEGVDGNDTLDVSINLAGAYLTQGQAKQSIGLLDPLIPVLERKYGAESSKAIDAKEYLAEAYTRTGELARAIEIEEKTLANQRRLLGPDHPRTLSAEHELAVAYYRAGQYARAQSLYGDAVEGMSRILGPRHPSTLVAKNDLAQAYASLGEWAHAGVMFDEVYQSFRETLGADHMKTLVAGHNVAGNLMSEGRYAESEQWFLDTIAGLSRTLPARHPQRYLSEDSLAQLYRAEGKYSLAEEIGARMVAAERENLGPDDPQTLASMGRLAVTYSAMGRNAEAEKLGMETLVGMRRVLGASHPRSLIVANQLAVVYWKEAMFDKGIALLREIQPLFEKALPDHWQRFHSQSLLGMNLIGLSQRSEGEALLKAGFAGIMQRKATIAAQDRDFSDRIASAIADLGGR